MKPVKPNTIEGVVHDQLCNTCGACSVACPTNAISYEETVGGHVYPAIDDTLCTECGLCLKVCAGKADSPTLLNALPKKPFHGECLDAWVGRSNDDAVYRAGQSGGVVSQLLLDLLEGGEVDACAVVNMPAGNPPRAVPFLARNREEILAAQKSKYCPVPLLQVLREAKETNSRIAVVGLSCHLHGLKLLEDVIDIKSIVKYRIGLICEHIFTFAAVDYLLGKGLTQQRNKNTKLIFKDKGRTGYPGDVSVCDEDGIVSIIPKAERMAVKDFLTPARCRVCFDKMNVLADVTVGDPWGLDGVDRQNGESVVIARTETGNALIGKSLNKDTLSLRQVDYEEVVRGQKIDRKSSQWKLYSDIWKSQGRSLPGFHGIVLPHSNSVSHPSSKPYERRLDNAFTLDNHFSRKQILRSTRRRLISLKLYRGIAHRIPILRSFITKINEKL